jgi:hypothetical protein
VQPPQTKHSFRQQRLGARAEYQQDEARRVKESPTLAEKFQRLKSLSIDSTHISADTGAPSGRVNFTVNLQNARSVFRVQCPNTECVRGDFDLTKVLSSAVAAKRKQVTGKLVCRGWRNRATINTVACGNALHYKMTLGY